ncbi:MAG: Fe-Mn family superoxide dismutase [Candidatus Paceibacterota bacterium]|jgi:Fe-Mn family superoxide dismutase
MSEHFAEKKFTIPTLKGISEKTITEHMKLYAGYVKFANLIQDQITELLSDVEKNAYAIGELNRRFAFEFDGMRNHEYYFHSLEGGHMVLDSDSALKKAIEKEWGLFDVFLTRFKAVALTRGIGWAMLSCDPHTKKLITSWVDEQHIGQLIGLQPILALDMWEHSYLFDYIPAEKKNYVEAFFENLNWSVIEENYKKAVQ